MDKPIPTDPALRQLRIALVGLATIVGVSWSASGRAAPLSSTPVTNVAQQHVVVLRSNDAFRIAPAEIKEWYEEGQWPLIGSILTVLFTNAIAIGVVYLTSGRAFAGLLKQRKVEQIASSLNEFYNPLWALLEANAAIFDQTGPKSWPDEHIERGAAALVWTETKKKILSNNQAIEQILQTKSHLIFERDSLDNYKELLVHVAMYDAYQRVGTDLYGKFLFPTEIGNHVNNMRYLVLGEYFDMTEQTI